MNTLKKEQILAIAISSICIVFGILFCAIPLQTLSFIETIACVILLVYGIVCLLAYCLKNTEVREWSLFLKGAISTAVGLLVMFIGALFVICLGLVVALSGAVYIKTAVDEKKEGDKSWWVSLIIGVAFALVGLSVAILYNTALAKNAIMIVFGIGLILDGVVRLIYTFVIHKQLRSLLTKNDSNVVEAEFEVKSAESQEEQKTQNNKENIQKIEEKQEKIQKNDKNNDKDAETDLADGGFV